VGTRGTDLGTLERDYASLDDRMLVLDFQAGQPEAFVEIHHRHGPLARRVCGRYLRNAQDADEAFQETMIRVYQGLHRFNGSYALRPWIARIAANVSIDAIRAHDRRPEFDDGEIEDHDHADPGDGPEAAYERLIERDLVISVLTELPESHRTALVLRELEGRSHKEIGQAMGMSAAQAKALIHRAKGSFRRGWFRAVTDRGGLAGIAMLPLIWGVKLFDGVRKVADRVIGQAGQVAQAATPDVITTAASSPTVATAASSVGERVVATASLTKHDDSSKDAKVVAAAPTNDPEPAVTEPVVAPPEDRPKQVVPVDASRNAPDPSTEPSAEPMPSDAPSPDPSDTPSPEPPQEPTPPPPPPPAPAWSGSFATAQGLHASVNPLSQPTVIPGANDSLLFYLAVSGDLSGPGEAPIGHAYLDSSGWVSGGDGSFSSLWLWIDTPDGRFSYAADASLSEESEGVDGSKIYAFAGAYALSGMDDVPAALPKYGSLTITLRVWPDGTLFATDVEMAEA
jgi:RNA polymerase sigma-70 factor (ECF subfamily)